MFVLWPIKTKILTTENIYSYMFYVNPFLIIPHNFTDYYLDQTWQRQGLRITKTKIIHIYKKAQYKCEPHG